MTDRAILAADGPNAPAVAPNTKSFRGDFMLTLRVRRQTFEEAEEIARQLLGLFPDDTYFIDRQIARVKMTPTEVKAHD